MKTLISIILFIIVIIPVYAQNEISGTTYDSKDNKALIGTTIYIPEIHKGTLSRKNGEYSLKGLPNGKFKIQFSFLGYETITKTVQFVGEPIKLDIKLNPRNIYSEEVVVSANSFSTQHDNAIKIDLVNADAIQTSGALSLPEEISHIPGVDMISKGNGVVKPVVRGLSNSNILLLNNGIKMENYQFSENHPFMVNDFGVDKIEVIKGPASLLYGSDAIGGVINVIEEKPAAVNSIVGDYNIRYLSNTNGISTNLGVKGSNEDFYWGIRGGIQSNEDYYDGSDIFVPNSRFSTQGLKLNTGLNKSYGSFKLFYNYNAMKLGMTTKEALALVNNRSRKNDFWYQNLADNLVGLKNTLFIDDFKIGANLSYQFNKRQLITDNQTAVNMDLGALSYELKLWLPSNDDSQFILGLQGNNQNSKNHDAVGHILPDYQTNNLSAYGLAQYHFFEKLNTQAGFRYEHSNIFVPQQDIYNMNEIKRNYNNISFSLGATMQATKYFLFRANFASAFRTPNIAELTQDGQHGNRYEIGNKELTSQKSYESDLSLHFHSDYLAFSLAGFYNKINNYIYLSPTDSTTNKGIDIFRYKQNNANIYGLETSLSINLFDNVNFNTNYSWLIAKQENGEYLPLIPQNKLKFEFVKKQDKILFMQKFYVKVGMMIAFEQNHPSMFESKTDSYNLLNAGFGFQVNWSKQIIMFDIIANNLLDTEYIDHLSTLRNLNYGNIGRNISLNIKVPFEMKK